MAWGDTIFPASQADRDEAVELSRQLRKQGYKGVYLNETETLGGSNDQHPYVQAMARRAYRALEDKSDHPCKKPDCTCLYFCAITGIRI